MKKVAQSNKPATQCNRLFPVLKRLSADSLFNNLDETSAANHLLTTIMLLVKDPKGNLWPVW